MWVSVAGVAAGLRGTASVEAGLNQWTRGSFIKGRRWFSGALTLETQAIPIGVWCKAVGGKQNAHDPCLFCVPRPDTFPCRGL